MELRRIKAAKDKQAYRKLCKYCFVDTSGWTDGMLTNAKEACAVYGAFEAKELKSAIISKHYEINLFGSAQEMVGISAVASYPESRNKGFVRALMRKILEDERAAGRTVSCLYPFSFAYYAKFGYGPMGEYRHVSLSPEDILPVEGALAMVPFDGSKCMFNDLQSLESAYLARFDFSSRTHSSDAKHFTQDLEDDKKSLYLSYRDGKASAVLQYSLRPTQPHASELVLETLRWTTPEGLRDLMAHLASHRGQCEKISGDIPQSVPFHLFCAEPRLETSVIRSWMARPLDLKAILEAKLADGASGDRALVDEPFTFSVEDPMLPQETASYTVSPDGVQKKDHDGTNPLALPVLSGLLFGGYSATEAVDAGLCGPWLATHGGFFAKKRGNFLNERF